MTPPEAAARALDLLYGALDRGAQRAALKRERERIDAEQSDLELLTTDDPGRARRPHGLAERLQELSERQTELDADLTRLDTQ